MERPRSQSSTIQPCVIAGLPINLWDCDLLSQLGIIMCSPNVVVTVQIFKNGYLPGKGLEKDGSGMLQPLEAKPRTPRVGLEIFFQGGSFMLLCIENIKQEKFGEE